MRCCSELRAHRVSLGSGALKGPRQAYGTVEAVVRMVALRAPLTLSGTSQRVVARF